MKTFKIILHENDLKKIKECMTIGNENGKYKCYCIWDFPSENAYFWFRLIAGLAPMVMIFWANIKIQESIKQQDSIIKSLMGATMSIGSTHAIMKVEGNSFIQL